MPLKSPSIRRLLIAYFSSISRFSLSPSNFCLLMESALELALCGESCDCKELC
jgi:hypothetical protein